MSWKFTIFWGPPRRRRRSVAPGRRIRVKWNFCFSIIRRLIRSQSEQALPRTRKWTGSQENIQTVGRHGSGVELQADSGRHNYVKCARLLFFKKNSVRPQVSTNAPRLNSKSSYKSHQVPPSPTIKSHHQVPPKSHRASPTKSHQVPPGKSHQVPPSPTTKSHQVPPSPTKSHNQVPPSVRIWIVGLVWDLTINDS